MIASSILRKYVIPLLAAAIAISVYMRSGGETAKAAAVLGFNPEDGQVVRSEDTHGGCHATGIGLSSWTSAGRAGALSRRALKRAKGGSLCLSTGR